MPIHDYELPLTITSENGTIGLKSSELTHHGILGMKWGIRKDRSSEKRYTIPEKKADIELDSKLNI